MLQSHRQPLPHPWLAECLDSVQAWAAGAGFEWCFTDNALFDELSGAERACCADQPVVASDVARLRWCQRKLAEGYERVVWCDADTLILDAERLTLPGTGCAFGRELWLQGDARAPRLYRKIHNACMVFCAGDPVLDFYAYAAARLIANYAAGVAKDEQAPSAAPPHDKPTMVPQLAGPKFLTHLHNVVQFSVLETAQVISPLLAVALLERDETLLQRYRENWQAAPAVVNLCASEVLRGSLTDSQQERLVMLLRCEGSAAFLSRTQGLM